MKCVVDLLLHTVSFENRRSAVIVANPVPRASGDLTDHVDHPIRCHAIVANDFVDFFGEKIAHGALGQIRFLEESAWRRIILNRALDFGPLVEKNTQIAHST